MSLGRPVVVDEAVTPAAALAGARGVRDAIVALFFFGAKTGNDQST